MTYLKLNINHIVILKMLPSKPSSFTRIIENSLSDDLFFPDITYLAFTSS